MVATNSVTPEPQRFSIRLPRPLWIGLATVLLVIVAIGLQIGMPIYRQQAAIREIERIGGWVGATLGGPDWLRECVGDEWMRLLRDEPTTVKLDWTDADDKTLMQVSQLSGVEYIHLRHARITDAGLKKLSVLRRLRLIDAFGTDVTESGIRDLKQSLPHVEVRLDL
jgi:hypothetical protein